MDPKVRALLGYKELEELLQGLPTQLYHGTTASFQKFDLSRSRDALVDQFYGKGIFLTPRKRIAWQYAEADRNIGFPPSIIQDVKRVDSDAGRFLDLLIRQGDGSWYEEYSPGVTWADAMAQGRIQTDLNTIHDIAGYVLDSKVRALGGGDRLLFDMTTGMPDWVYDSLDEVGLDSTKYRPKVYTVVAQADNVLVTARRDQARNARKKGYDAVIFYGRGTVGNVPEVAFFDPRRVKIQKVETE